MERSTQCLCKRKASLWDPRATNGLCVSSYEKTQWLERQPGAGLHSDRVQRPSLRESPEVNPPECGSGNPSTPDRDPCMQQTRLTTSPAASCHLLSRPTAKRPPSTPKPPTIQIASLVKSSI